MTKYCAHGHPMEEWMNECPFCSRAEDGVRKVLGSQTQPVAVPTPEAQTELVGGPPLRPTVIDGYTDYFRQPLQKTVVDSAGPAARPPAALPLMGWLVVMSGPAKWRDIRLDQEQLLVGTDPGCHLCLADAAAAPRHAALIRKKDRLLLQDLSGGGGIYINNAPQPVKQHFLEDEDLIKLGSTFLKFRKL
jgi:hypothetical protein